MKLRMRRLASHQFWTYEPTDCLPSVTGPLDLTALARWLAHPASWVSPGSLAGLLPVIHLQHSCSLQLVCTRERINQGWLREHTQHTAPAAPQPSTSSQHLHSKATQGN